MNLSLDIGGTNLRVGITSLGENFFKEVLIIPTPKSKMELINELKSYIGFVEIKKVVVGIAGVINLNNELIFSPHLTQFLNINLKDLFLKEILGYDCDFSCFNDVQLASFAEAVKGRGLNFSRSLYLSLGTGLGGGLIINKKLENYIHFEPGHLILNTLNKESNIFLEDIVAGGGILKNYNELPKDPEFWIEREEILAKNISNIILLLNPDCIVFGGGLVISNKYNIDNLRDKIFNNLRIKYLMPEIFKTELGDLITLKGAIAFIQRDNYFN